MTAEAAGLPANHAKWGGDELPANHANGREWNLDGRKYHQLRTIISSFRAHSRDSRAQLPLARGRCLQLDQDEVHRRRADIFRGMSQRLAIDHITGLYFGLGGL